MPRLKTLLARLGLPSLRTCAARMSYEAEDQPVEPRPGEFRINPANRWRGWSTPAQTRSSNSGEQLSDLMLRLRETLSQVAEELPLASEPEATAPVSAAVFDRDLFDGEPLHAGAGTAAISGLDEDLFEDVVDLVDPPARRAPASSGITAACQPSA